MGWLLRKSIGLATITAYIRSHTDEDGKLHIDIDNNLTGGVKGTTEHRTIDGNIRVHEDYIFGTVHGHSVLASVGTIKDEKAEIEAHLKNGWLPECEAEGSLIYTLAENRKNGWTARQVWGFQDVGGKRMYARNVAVSKGDQIAKAKFYYDYLGPIDQK